MSAADAPDPRTAPISPLNLFQERYRSDGWRLLCCTICLNLCSGRALEAIHEDLFSLWPTPVEMGLAIPGELECLLSPLGLQRRRTRSLIRMSLAYAFLWDGLGAIDLPGIGRYGTDSYDIFIRGRLDVLPQDKELKRYLEWMMTQG
jgi:methyl-CpG-binding domain protein 4